MSLKTIEMEIALSEYFGFTRNLIVPGMTRGLFTHETDLAVISKAGFVTEVEIKVSRSDMLNEKKKRHRHYCNKIKYLYFAIPDKMFKENNLEIIPDRAGIITVDKSDTWRGLNGLPYICEIKRPAKVQPAIKLTEEERYRCARLGAIRIWSLKKKILELQEQDKDNGA